MQFPAKGLGLTAYTKRSEVESRAETKRCLGECVAGALTRAQKSTQAKIRIGISHINPLIMKPNKVGISP